MLIRHGHRYKLDSTRKWGMKLPLNIKLLSRMGSRAMMRTGTHSWKRGERLHDGRFETPLKAANRQRGGMSLLRHYQVQPWETWQERIPGRGRYSAIGPAPDEASKPYGS